MQKDQFLALLEAAGLSQAELGRKLGIHPTTLYRWEEAPVYAVAYVNLYLGLKKLLEMQ